MPEMREVMKTMLAGAMLAAVSGCAVISVASTATSLAVGVVSTVADVAIGAGKVTARVVGAGVDRVTPGHSGAAVAPVTLK